MSFAERFQRDIFPAFFRVRDAGKRRQVAAKTLCQRGSGFVCRWELERGPRVSDSNRECRPTRKAFSQSMCNVFAVIGFTYFVSSCYHRYHTLLAVLLQKSLIVIGNANQVADLVTFRETVLRNRLSSSAMYLGVNDFRESQKKYCNRFQIPIDRGWFSARKSPLVTYSIVGLLRDI